MNRFFRPLTALVFLLATPIATHAVVSVDVPEPGALALLGLGLAGVILGRRSKQAKSGEQ